ncbi:MAG: dynamin family protein [Bryobacteraceae bacterium]
MDYANHLTSLLPAAAQLEKIAAEQNETFIGAAARELVWKIEQNRFHLVVVGQFKRGKTSFLNALLGDSVLPVAVLPLTSAVTILRYGEGARATVFFEAGGNRDIPIDRLPEFITEAGNPKNRKGVARAEVFYPSEYLKGGVTLIDTPGIASVYAHNTQATYDFVPKIDAAIFITSPEPPLTATEMEFLTDLMRHVNKIYVVMNKADLVSAVQLAEVLQFSQHALPSGLTDRGRIYTVSARQALEAKTTGNSELLDQSGFVELEAELNRFLREEKGSVLTDSLQRSLSRNIADLRMYLSLQIQATQMPIEELRGKISSFNEELQSAEQQREDNDLLLKGGVARLAGTFQEEAREFGESGIDVLSAAARTWFAQHRTLARPKLAAALDAFLAEQIQKRFDHWRDEYEAQASTKYCEITGRFQTGVNDLIREVREMAGTLFGVAIGHFEAIEELALLEPTGYRIDSSLGWGLENLPLLLPGSLFHRYLLRRTLKKIPDELERNATRVAHDFRKRLDKSVNGLQRAMNGKLGETIHGIRHVIETALERHEAGSAEAGKAIGTLSAAIRELDDLDARVRGVSAELNKPVEA